MMSCLSHTQTRGGYRCSSAKVVELSKRMTAVGNPGTGLSLPFSSPRSRRGTVANKRRQSPKMPDEPKIKKKPGPKPGWKNKFKPKGYIGKCDTT